MTEAADSLEKELTEEHLDVISDDGLTDDIDKNAESYDSFDEADTSTIATLTQALYEDGEVGNPKIKVCIEKVLEKLERDAEYRQGLEEDLENLEIQQVESLKTKLEWIARNGRVLSYTQIHLLVVH